MTIHAPSNNFRLVHTSATISRKDAGYEVERYYSMPGFGDFSHDPLWFPRGELLTALGYAEMCAGVLAGVDPDTRPKWLEQTV